MTVTLHYLNKSRAIRVIWLLEHLEIPYETKVYFRDPKTMLAPAELAKIHPSGASPILEDDGEVYAESGHILEHLITKYGSKSDLIWKDAKEENQIKYALYSAESNIMISGMMLGIHGIAAKKSPLPLRGVFSKVFNKVDSFYAKGTFDKCLTDLNNQIKENKGFYCNGHFTVADIMFNGTLVQLINLGTIKNFKQYPEIQKWLDNGEKILSKKAANAKEKELDNSKKN